MSLSAIQALWLLEHCALGIPTHLRMSCLLSNGMFVCKYSLRLRIKGWERAKGGMISPV